MSPGPEKRPEAESGTGEAAIQGNAWSLKTIVLRIVECLLLIPVFLAASGYGKETVHCRI